MVIASEYLLIYQLTGFLSTRNMNSLHQSARQQEREDVSVRAVRDPPVAIIPRSLMLWHVWVEESLPERTIQVLISPAGVFGMATRVLGAAEEKCEPGTLLYDVEALAA